MTSEVSICNQALQQVGESGLTSLDDPTQAARSCRLLYAPIRDAVLQEGAWTFATKRAALLPDATPPEWGYGSRFLLPNHTLLVREVYSDPNHYNPTTDPWEREGDYLLCDLEKIWIRYIARIEDPTRFPPMFVQALVMRLAAELAIPVVQSRQLKAEAEGLYRERIQNALNTDGTQGQNRKVKSQQRLTKIRGLYYGKGLRR